MIPSPSKFHYTFSMRELSRVFQVNGYLELFERIFSTQEHSRLELNRPMPPLYSAFHKLSLTCEYFPSFESYTDLVDSYVLSH